MSFQVEVTGLNSVLVQNLSSLSRYLVSVRSHYPQGLSAALTSNVTTCKSHTLSRLCLKASSYISFDVLRSCVMTHSRRSIKLRLLWLKMVFFPCLLVKVPSPSDLRVTNFSGSDITVRWEAAADDVVSYLIKWISLSGGDLRQVGMDERVLRVHHVSQRWLCDVTMPVCVYFSWGWAVRVKGRYWRGCRTTKNTRSLCLHFMEMELRVKLWPHATAPVSHTHTHTLTRALAWWWTDKVKSATHRRFKK